MKVNIKDQLPKYLGEVKLLTTKCCIQECEKLGPQVFGATVILKQFGIHKCKNEDCTKPATKCLKAMVGTKNENRYFIATQDPELREKCRKVPGTPILYLHSSAPTLGEAHHMFSRFFNLLCILFHEVFFVLSYMQRSGYLGVNIISLFLIEILGSS